MGNQNQHSKEIEISRVKNIFKTNNEYDLDIYNHKDISIQQEIKTNHFRKPRFSFHFDSVIEDIKGSDVLNLKPRETNCSENMSIKSAGLRSIEKTSDTMDKLVVDDLLLTKELKCSVCGQKAIGVCALCLVARFCKACFEEKHKNADFEDNPYNIHKLTYYKKNINIYSPLRRRNHKNNSIISSKKGGSSSGGSSATIKNQQPSSFFNSLEEKLNEKT